MENNIVNTLLDKNRVSSTYAEIYLDDTYCNESKKHESKPLGKHSKHVLEDEVKSDEWISPSDQLIGIIELKPPFTSKINRGKTHEGILSIGNTVLEQERARFLDSLTALIKMNDASWERILTHERNAVTKKVKRIYENIFEHKSKIMSKELSDFYENNLHELEDHMRSELQTVVQSSRCNIISALNNEIKQKLKIEKKRLEDILRKRLLSEVKKVNTYYTLLFRNEMSKNENIISHALHERNDAIRAYLRQTEAENITSAMYVMSLERKKCKIKNMILQRHQDTETMEKLTTLKEKKQILEHLKEKDVPFWEINKEWEEKIRKIVKIFLKFISFSLKLLPEQTAFLLDLEKMVVLQLNEIQISKENAPTILLNENELTNTFDFADKPTDVLECRKEPFVLIGDLSDPIPPRYGSRETLPSDVDLPLIRLQRQYVYAKCHGYEDIKNFLKSQVCQCSKKPTPSPSTSCNDDNVSPPVDEKLPTPESVSSEELLLCDNFRRLSDCPARTCRDYTNVDSFPFLPAYTDYTDENYERVTTILSKTPVRKESPDLINPKHIVYQELPFSATKERCRTIETQYSSQEEIYINDLPCTCTCLDIEVETDTKYKPYDSTTEIKSILNKRKNSLLRLMAEHPKLLNLFTEESFDTD